MLRATSSSTSASNQARASQLRVCALAGEKNVTSPSHARRPENGDCSFLTPTPIRGGRCEQIRQEGPTPEAASRGLTPPQRRSKARHRSQFALLNWHEAAISKSQPGIKKPPPAESVRIPRPGHPRRVITSANSTLSKPLPPVNGPRNQRRTDHQPHPHFHAAQETNGVEKFG